MSPLSQRHTRCQGAIVSDHHILLIRHQNHADGSSYWLLPGGGLEEGETPEICLIREMQEETGLDVQIERLLMEDDATQFPGTYYRRRLTFLCTPLAGEARPGYEPEVEASARYKIAEVRWVDLHDEKACFDLVGADPWSGPTLKRIRALLGYSA